MNDVLLSRLWIAVPFRNVIAGKVYPTRCIQFYVGTLDAAGFQQYGVGFGFGSLFSRCSIHVHTPHRQFSIELIHARQRAALQALYPNGRPWDRRLFRLGALRVGVTDLDIMRSH